MFVASVLVCVVMGVVQPLCAYVKRKWAFYMTSPLEQSEIGANSKQLEAQNLNESEGVGFEAPLKVIRASRYGAVKCAILAFYGFMAISISTVKSKVTAIAVCIYSTAISRVTADQPEKTYQEMRRSSPTEDLKGGQAVSISDFTQAETSPESVADQPGNRKPSAVNTEGIPFATNASKKNDDLRTPQNTFINIHPQLKTSSRCDTRRNEPRSRKTREQSNALPTIDHTHVPRPAEKQEKVWNTGKLKKGAASPSVCTRSNVDNSAVRSPLGKEKKYKQKKAVTPARVDLPAQTTYKAKEKVMPCLIPPCHVNAIVRAKAYVQKQCSPKVGISNLITPVKVKSESQIPSACENDNRSSTMSAEVQDVIDHAVRQAKRRNNERDLANSDGEASVVFISQSGLNTAVPRIANEITKNPLEFGNNAPRKNLKRKTGGDPTAGSNYEPIVLNPSKQTDQLTPQQELMEVGVSEELPLIIQPENMEVNNELNDVEVSFEESRAAYYQRPTAANTNVTEPLETMETNAELQETEEEMEVTQEHVSTWNFFPFYLPSFLSKPSQPPEEEMEVTQEQGSSWNFFSFSLPSFLGGPFTSQPAVEEMETDAQLAAAMASNTEPEEMEIYQEPPAMTTPFGQPDMGNKLPTQAAGVGRPVPQQQIITINHQPFDVSRQVASPFGELVETKRPLASRVGMFGGAAMSVKIPPAEQPVIQPAMQSVMKPLPQQMMQPGVQPVLQQPVVQEVMQPAMQQAMQPPMQQVMQSAVQQVMQPAMQQVMQPAMQLVVQPTVQQVMQPAMQPVMQSVIQQPGMQQVMQPAMQSVNQTVTQQVMQRPGVHTQQLQVNSAMKSTLLNSSSVGQQGSGEFATSENAALTSDVRDQDAALKTRNQLIMEQLQIVPSTVPASNLDDDSDSDSEYDSDDENTPCSDVREQDANHTTGNQLIAVPPSTDPACYQADFYGVESGDNSDDEFELDLETIENFSYLEKSPDHAQLITKLLMDKEANEWHRGYQRRDSESDSDCGDKYELSELLDPETSEMLSQMESSSERAQLIKKLLAEKKAQWETSEWHDVLDPGSADESDDHCDLIEQLELSRLRK